MLNRKNVFTLAQIRLSVKIKCSRIERNNLTTSYKIYKYMSTYIVVTYIKVNVRFKAMDSDWSPIKHALSIIRSLVIDKVLLCMLVSEYCRSINILLPALSRTWVNPVIIKQVKLYKWNDLMYLMHFNQSVHTIVSSFWSNVYI